MPLLTLVACGLFISATRVDTGTPTDTPPGTTGTDSAPPTDTDTGTAPVPCEPVDLVGVVIALDAPATNDLMRWVTVSLDQAADAAVACVADDDPTDTYLVESGASTTQHKLELTGLRAETSYTCGVVSTCPGDALAEPFAFSTGPLAEGTPEVNVETHESLVSHSGYVMTNHVDLCEDRTRQLLLIYDLAGRVRWSWDTPGTDGPGVESSYLGDGRVFWGGGNQVGGPPSIVRLDHTQEPAQTWSGGESVLFHHDAAYLDDSRYVGLTEDEQEDDGETYIAFDLTVFDPADGVVSWTWGSGDGIAQGALDRDGVTNDPFHANSFSWQQRPEGDRVWISLCGDYSVIGVDVESREVIAKLGMQGDMGLYDRDGEWLKNTYHTRCTHGIHALDDRILVYDNGRDLDGSRVTEYRLDLEAMDAVFWWSWTEPEWHEGTLGDADWIDDERVLVAESHNECTADPVYPGDLTNVVEVDMATDAVVWRLVMDSPHDTNYRAQSLDGCGVFSATQACTKTQARFEELRPALGW